MEKFEVQTYRDSLTKALKSEKDREKRKDIWEKAKKANEYQTAQRIHRELVSIKNNPIEAESESIDKDEYMPAVALVESEKKNKLISLEELEKLLLNENLPRKKVLLVEGNVPHFIEGNEERSGYFFSSEDKTISDSTNLGIHRIAGYLDKFGVPNEIIRLQDIKSQEDFQEAVKDADIIAMSALSPSINEAFSFCSKVKADFPEKTIIGGAEHFALDYEWILSHKEETGVDICCTGQGELPILALSLGVSPEDVGSVAFVEKKHDDETSIVKNRTFPKIGSRSSKSKLLQPIPAKPMKKEWMPMIFPELRKYFEYAGSTQTGTGCPYGCNFCTNENFLGQDYIKTIDVAKKEVMNLYEQGVDFMFVRDPMLNTNHEHLDEFLRFMTALNESISKKIGWFAFIAVRKASDYIESERFKKMADAGCTVIAVGVEDVVGDRRKIGKGGTLEEATKFINAAKEHLLVRALTILGLPAHYSCTREEIKGMFLEFMKSNPQALYRMNFWTPIVGTDDFENYNTVLYKDIREDIGAFREHDTMHSVIDPTKMYDKLNIPEEKRWVKSPNDWMILRDEIIKEYLCSEEHQRFLDGLKGKSHIDKENLLYYIASDYKDLALGEK